MQMEAQLHYADAGGADLRKLECSSGTIASTRLVLVKQRLLRLLLRGNQTPYFLPLNCLLLEALAGARSSSKEGPILRCV